MANRNLVLTQATVMHQERSGCHLMSSGKGKVPLGCLLLVIQVARFSMLLEQSLGTVPLSSVTYMSIVWLNSY